MLPRAVVGEAGAVRIPWDPPLRRGGESLRAGKYFKIRAKWSQLATILYFHRRRWSVNNRLNLGVRMADKTILLLNGPNLNLLGSREPGIYGATTLAEIEARLAELAHTAGVTLTAFQSNAEAELVTRVQQAAKESVGFILINPAAFTHTSVALRDALAAVAIPFIEIHLSNVHAREPFRRHSYFSDIAAGVISGLGPAGYELALTYAIRRIKEN